ncbi:MAG: hypothetical protein KatS3mg131_0531 [Candidatus Tectimicrobiota bacterium]|nr:MAG: hypothetical protein KatS3mg131_0531 [Candidatus Tectomicrobia bacterium]
MAQQGAFLAQTLRHLFAPAPHLEDLERLEIAFYQEGADQRVWRAQVTLRDGRCGVFGLIAARAPGASSALTQRDFCHLRALHARQPQYCARPYLGGTLPLAGGGGGVRRGVA